MEKKNPSEEKIILYDAAVGPKSPSSPLNNRSDSSLMKKVTYLLYFILDVLFKILLI